MRVLALASYPVQAASTRYRLTQFVGPLAARGVDLQIRPFLGPAAFAGLYRRSHLAGTLLSVMWASAARLADILLAMQADVLLVQREAMLWGPPWLEWLLARVVRIPMVLDLDDATWVRYDSPTYGPWIGWLKCFWKTDLLIRWARAVSCGNPHLVQHVEGAGGRAVLVPTVVDTTVFTPRRHRPQGPPRLGWIGTPSTYRFLEGILPSLSKLAQTHRFVLLIVGSGRPAIDVPGVEVDCRAWCLEHEVGDFQSIDIGLYPLADTEYAAGKSGFKAVQYMALGIPFVMSPVGVCATLGVPDQTHLLASGPDSWHRALALLLDAPPQAARMGASGRAYARQNFSLETQADRLAILLRDAAAGGTGPAPVSV